MALPLILHLPHDSMDIPAQVRGQFVLSDGDLHEELIRMTDAHTGALFSNLVVDVQVVRCSVSRLVTDVERFAEDSQEIMSGVGMGFAYTKTAHGGTLRRRLTEQERSALLDDFYWPHHDRLTQLVVRTLQASEQVLILDAHSFPSRPLPYERVQDPQRPDICIGTDEFHTPASVRDAFMDAFAKAGFSVTLNTPFAGALVPLKYYQIEPRVSSVMVEINRSLYMDESNGARLPSFGAIADKIQACCRVALAGCNVEIPDLACRPRSV